MANLNNTFEEINISLSGVNEFLTFDALKVSVGGGLTVDTSTLVVDADQNKVGIGTTSLSEKLTVNGNIKSSSNVITNGLTVSSSATIGGSSITSAKINEWNALYNGPTAISLPSEIASVTMYPNIYIDWYGNNSSYNISDIIDQFITSFPSDIVRKGKFTIVNSTYGATNPLSFGRGSNFLGYIGTTSDMTEYTDYNGSTIATSDDWSVPRSGHVTIQLIYRVGEGYHAFVTGNILPTGGTPEGTGTSGGTTTPAIP